MFHTLMKFFTSGSLFKRHPPHDSTLHDVIISSFERGLESPSLPEIPFNNPAKTIATVMWRIVVIFYQRMLCFT